MLRLGLAFTDILPENTKSYDKMRPPKTDGLPTKVFFHVTVMGLDSIDETSMVRRVMGWGTFTTFDQSTFRLMPPTFFSLKPGKMID